MKQILVLLLVLAALAVGIWAALRQPEGTIADTVFAWEDTASLERIFLADGGTREVVLRRGKGRWTVNGRYPARPDAIHTLLKTVADIRVRHPAPKSKLNTIVRDIAGNHIKVELYDDRNRKVRSYFVGPSPPSDRGNFMLLEDGASPYLVHIPGWAGFLTPRFILDPVAWRDRTVFAVPAERIARLRMDYPANPYSSWTLTRVDRNRFEVVPDRAEFSGRSVNDRAALAYLERYRHIGAEAYLNDLPGRDSVLASDPICVIELTDLDGRTTTCRLFYRPVTRRTKTLFDPSGNPLEFERDKYYAAIHGGEDLVLVQDFVFGKLFLGPSYFFQPEPKTRETG